MELYYPRATYCRTDGKISIRRVRKVGVALPKNEQKKLAVNKLSKIGVLHNSKAIHGMKLRNVLYLHGVQ